MERQLDVDYRRFLQMLISVFELDNLFTLQMRARIDHSIKNYFPVSIYQKRKMAQKMKQLKM